MMNYSNWFINASSSGRVTVIGSDSSIIVNGTGGSSG